MAAMAICFLNLQVSATLLPSVGVIAQGKFCGAKHTHHTFMPVVKQQVKLQQQ